MVMDEIDIQLFSLHHQGRLGIAFRYEHTRPIFQLEDGGVGNDEVVTFSNAVDGILHLEVTCRKTCLGGDLGIVVAVSLTHRDIQCLGRQCTILAQIDNIDRG